MASLGKNVGSERKWATEPGARFGPRVTTATPVPSGSRTRSGSSERVFAITNRAVSPGAGWRRAAGACAMHGLPRARVAGCLGAVLLWALLGGTAAGMPESRPEPLAPPLRTTPLAVMRLTGAFGEVRSGHVHAGVDLSTGQVVGAAVRAPVAGAIVRVRASGVGYGRSLYLESADGRLMVFGHLDAFAPALAAFMDSAQRATGQYETDLWPAPGRFRFAAGDTIGWSGQSGAGGPHLHFEVRHADFALDPLLCGVTQPAGLPPRLEALTLEPLDTASFVRRRSCPQTFRLSAARETVLVEGAVRAIVRSRAGLAGVRGAPPWSTSATWAGGTVEARLDSISWAGEMAELDLVVDHGRISASGGFILWKPPGVTPRFLAASDRAWDGTIVVRPGDPPAPLTLRACDANGREATRTVWLRGPRPSERGADTLAHGAGPERPAPRWSFAAVPGGRLRVRLAGAPRGLSRVRLGIEGDATPVAATADGASWCAVIAPRDLPRDTRIVASGRLPGGGGPWSARTDVTLLTAGAPEPVRPAPGATLLLRPADVFEPGVVVARAAGRTSAPGQGLVARSEAFTLEPSVWPLRRGATVTMELAEPPDSATDLYRRGSDGSWSALGARWDAATRSLRATTSSFGTFGVLRDDVAPRVTVLAPPRVPPAAPYPRWELAARVVEEGSGVDVASSWLEVDGARVPSEWDPERSELRWRPLAPPEPGTHAVTVRVADRAGHVGRASASFVLDSGRR
jgi:murein DD-endopeptidase MepM/ murein hydrolase activator NlpD